MIIKISRLTHETFTFLADNICNAAADYEWYKVVLMNSENTDINIKSDICKHIHKVSVCFFIDCHFSLLISTS